MPQKTPQLIDTYQKLFGDLQSCYTCAYVSCLQKTNNNNKNGGINYKGNGRCNGNFGASSKKAAAAAVAAHSSAAYFLSIALFTSIFIDDARHRTSGTAKNYEVSIETHALHSHTHTHSRDQVSVCVLEKRR